VSTSAPSREQAESAAARLEDAPAEDVVRWALAEFGDDVCVASSMQDAVLVHLASRIRPGIPVIFLDTGYHFAETIGTRDAAEAAYPIRLIDVTPAQSVAEQDAEHGPRLYERDPDRCCALRKVEPLARALQPYQAWMTGVRRQDDAGRHGVPVVQWDAKREMIKVNPLAAWTDDDVAGYVEQHGVLVNPLVQLGYLSIGCAPCTRAVAPGEDPRAGRWAGLAKTECGLHT
jgi:phosphoadenosine phosphosulfate reductase